MVTDWVSPAGVAQVGPAARAVGAGAVQEVPAGLREAGQAVAGGARVRRRLHVPRPAAPRRALLAVAVLRQAVASCD